MRIYEEIFFTKITNTAFSKLFLKVAFSALSFYFHGTKLKSFNLINFKALNIPNIYNCYRFALFILSFPSEL